MLRGNGAASRPLVIAPHEALGVFGEGLNGLGVGVVLEAEWAPEGLGEGLHLLCSIAEGLGHIVHLKKTDGGQWGSLRPPYHVM